MNFETNKKWEKVFFSSVFMLYACLRLYLMSAKAHITAKQIQKTTTTKLIVKIVEKIQP